MGRNSQRRRAAKLRKQPDRRRSSGAPRPTPHGPDGWYDRPRTEVPAPRGTSTMDEHLAAAVRHVLQSGWSAADLLHAHRRQPARSARLLERVLGAADDGSLAAPPFIVPWCEAEGIDVPTGARAVTALVLLLHATPPIPPRRREARSRATTDVLARVRALLAKAESTPFASEAEAFTAKAQELMTRHAIDDAMLAASADLAGAGRGVAVGRVLLEEPYLAQKADLLHVITRANDSRAVLHPGLGMATVVGAAADLDMVELLFTSLLLQATVAMQEAGRAHPDDRTRRFRAAFLQSFAVRIGERLGEARTVATAAGERTYGSALVPVLADKVARIDQAVDELFPHVQRRRRSSTVDSRGWAAGRQAADRADTGTNPGLAG